MAKQTATKTSTPAATGFLAQLAQMATPAASAKLKADATPIERMRAKFEVHANEQIKALATDTKSKWFNVNHDGSVTLALRNGNTAITVNGAAYFNVADRDAAVNFLKTAVEAVKAGEMDDQLQATQRKKATKQEA